jgi:hypothetical protein
MSTSSFSSFSAARCGFHHVVELVGAGVVEDFLVGQHDRDRHHLRAELGVVEQLGRNRVEEVIAVVPDGRAGLVVEQPLPDDRAGIGLPLVLALQHASSALELRHEILIALARSSSASDRISWFFSTAPPR